ncbi:MAG: exodeoxyribonuclease V subunit gamma [Verrucomicrobia bacterium]|nr:exodeoxyribonuclease V subunit gamma [Verrucomicrobiota bacterium]
MGDSKIPERVFSNRMDTLAEVLADALFFQGGSPFEKRIVIVPSVAVRDFLYHFFAFHPRLQIAAGVEILLLHQALPPFPSSIEISLAIEEKLLLDLPKELAPYAAQIPALSDQLAQCFVSYGLHGVDFLGEWLSREGWQQTLFRTVIGTACPLLQVRECPPLKGNISLFGFSYLPVPYVYFFAERVKANFYQLSPTAGFWEDLLSDKQRVFLKVGGEDAPRLLSNLGGLSRKLIRSLGEYPFQEKEAYFEPEGDSLLAHIQRGLLHLSSTFPEESDSSIQVHSAVSKLREIEALREVLEKEIRHQDVLVLAPQIADYVPYIDLVFGESSFSYQIEGLPLASISDATRAFLQLLALPKERFALFSVMQLLRAPSFRAKWELEEVEVDLLEGWFEKAEIRRSLEGSPHAWDAGLERLLLGLALTPDVEEVVWPLDLIGQTDIPLFSKFLKIFSDLKEDLRALEEKRSAAEWFSLFADLAEKYLSYTVEKEPFFDELRSIDVLERKAPFWDFESIERFLRQIAEKKGGERPSYQLGKILFRSLKEGCLTPVRVIWCLNMDEESFPRMESKSSLSQLHTQLITEMDRLLFLELFLHAKDALFFSYERIEAKDNKPQGPSLLLDSIPYKKIDHPALPLEALSLPESAELPPFFCPKERPKLTQISLELLGKLARDPIGFYFQESLGISLWEEEGEEREFLLTPLARSRLRKEAIKTSIERVTEKAARQGKLPPGRLQEACVQMLAEEIGVITSGLASYGIEGNTLTHLHDCTLSLGEECTFTGTLTDLTADGMVFEGEDTLGDLVKVWPRYLFMRAYLPSHRKLYLSKEGACIEINIPDPYSALRDYVSYFHEARNSPSPLLPGCAEALLRKEESDFDKALEKCVERNLYLQYLQRRGALPSDLYNRWAVKLRALFGGIHERI